MNFLKDRTIPVFYLYLCPQIQLTKCLFCKYLSNWTYIISVKNFHPILAHCNLIFPVSFLAPHKDVFTAAFKLFSWKSLV